MRTFHPYIIFFGCLLLASCERFLESSPDRSLAIPSSVEEFARLLHNDRFYISDPSLADFSADDFFFSPQVWAGSHFRMRNAYIWAADLYEGTMLSGVGMDWNNPYNTIFHANVVLDGLDKLTDYDRIGYGNVKGHALFLRAFQHFQVYQLYGQPFRPASADRDAGIPLRLSADLETPVTRATVQATFDCIIDDLTQAYDLLPTPVPDRNKYSASKAATAALLARVHLAAQAYEEALAAADRCLQLTDALLDFNDLPASRALPLPTDNPEVLFDCLQAGTSGLLTNANTFADTLLMEMYDADDHRKEVFFKPHAQPDRYNFRSFYTGNQNSFSGLALDEVYLTRAECRARLGDNHGALADLNRLRAHRYRPEGFTPYSSADNPTILATVLAERRKELILRNTRWTDLRRLNQEPRFAVTLKRVLNGTVHELAPNDPRYTLPVPPREISLSNLSQN